MLIKCNFKGEETMERIADLDAVADWNAQMGESFYVMYIYIYYYLFI